MKRVLCTIAVLMLASVVFAGTTSMTPQQAMQATMNCPVCSAWTPEVSKNIRYDIFTTKNGYVESFMNADEASSDAFMKCAADCQQRAAGIATMSAADKAKLCPMCQARMALMGSKDVSMETFKTHDGMITVGTSKSAAGMKATQDYAAAMKAQSDLLEAAAKEMGKPGEMKSKM
jgi:hypothetical protein